MQNVACKFCGQVQSIKVYEGETAEVQAIMACDCEDAKAYRNKKTQIERAIVQIYDLFGEKASELYKIEAIDEDIIENIKAMLPMIQSKRIKNVNITVESKNQIKVTISYNNGKFIIKRSESNSAKREI